MFSAQAGQIANALKAAGLSPDAANKIAAILGNSRQTLASANPQTVDLTPASMRYVTPDARKYQLQNLDFRQADPYFQPYQMATSEERRPPIPAPAVRGQLSSQSSESPYRVSGGKFTNAKGAGEAVQMDLRFSGQGRLPMLDHQSNTIVGKNIRAEADDSGLRFQIEETGTELVWKLQLGDFLSRFGTTVTVVTGINLSSNGLTADLAEIRVLGVGQRSQVTISTIACEE